MNCIHNFNHILTLKLANVFIAPHILEDGVIDQQGSGKFDFLSGQIANVISIYNACHLIIATIICKLWPNNLAEIRTYIIIQIIIRLSFLPDMYTAISKKVVLQKP